MKSASAFRRGPQLLTATEWVCASCRRQGTQQRHITGASAATAASKRSRAREPLPIVPPPSPSRHSKAEPLKPLLKPIGQPDPPKAGDNPHYDPRSFSEKWEDYFDNHEAQRQWRKPAFQPWKQLYHHKGKTFLANPRPFREDAALYFPNFQGYTLADYSAISDTTKALRGKISIVRMVSEYWSAMQCDSWMDEVRHPELVTALKRLKNEGLQIVRIHITEERVKSLMVWWSKNWHRKQIPQEEWSTCFMVRRGVDDYMRRDIKMTNPKVGHVYLIDQNCKIRWAGCGDATDEERESLLSAVRRLVEPETFLAKQRKAGIEQQIQTKAAKLTE